MLRSNERAVVAENSKNTPFSAREQELSFCLRCMPLKAKPLCDGASGDLVPSRPGPRPFCSHPDFATRHDQDREFATTPDENPDSRCNCRPQASLESIFFAEYPTFTVTAIALVTCRAVSGSGLGVLALCQELHHQKLSVSPALSQLSTQLQVRNTCWFTFSFKLNPIHFSPFPMLGNKCLLLLFTSQYGSHF